MENRRAVKTILKFRGHIGCMSNSFTLPFRTWEVNDTEHMYCRYKFHFAKLIILHTLHCVRNSFIMLNIRHIEVMFHKVHFDEGARGSVVG
jgi:hypothetical protein